MGFESVPNSNQFQAPKVEPEEATSSEHEVVSLPPTEQPKTWQETERGLGQLASGEIVVDRFTSHLHGNVKELLPEVLSKVSADGRPYISEVVDVGRDVGFSICVETHDGDDIVYAQRENRPGLTRFVRNREPEPCSNVLVGLKKDEESGNYICMTAYVGNGSPPEPWDKWATPQSEPFWANHALIWDGIGIVPDTETVEPPTIPMTQQAGPEVSA